MSITDPRYPKCSAAGILRKSNGKVLVVSTSALYLHVGSKRYRKYLPLIEYANAGGPTPASAEKFLGGIATADDKTQKATKVKVHVSKEAYNKLTAAIKRATA